MGTVLPRVMKMLWDWTAVTVTQLVNILNATEHFKEEGSMVCALYLNFKRLSQSEKFYIMSNSNYITFWKRQNWGDNKKIRSWAREETNRQRTEDFHGNENTLFVLLSC